MRKRLFLDTNVLISGFFFSGNESTLLSLVDVDLFTCDLAIEELKEVVQRKFKSLGVESIKTALEVIDHSLLDIKIVDKNKYSSYIKKSEKLIGKKKDSKILAAAISINADMLITGDKDFHQDSILSLVRVVKTKDALKLLGF